MKNLLLLTASLVGTPILLVFCLIYLNFLLNIKQQKTLSSDHSKVAYAALPSNQELLYDRVGFQDGRTEILSKFFKKYKSDLSSYSDQIVSAADKYNLDYRLVPAIAMQESNLCKKIPAGSFNCWGFAIYGKNVKKFDSYSKAIDAVTKTLALEYKQKGLVEPEDIMRKYTPGSNGSWARGVSQYMAELHDTSL